MMASHGCINGTLVGTKYSAPVPVIGLYIAAATLVCMFLMIFDILVGIYTRKRWLPCKLFKLDSITLTLVSVVVKLTVDMTTPMPSVWDQLSKLCGTCLLCVYMGYIMPSVGDMNDSTNMYSLSILVITVFVNMCIQISTGVVVLFIREHIIILCIMLTLLWNLWSLAWRMEVSVRYTRETSRNLFTRSKETVLQRLKICYLYGYSADSQFRACNDFCCNFIGWLNPFCLAILIEAAIRSVIMKRDKFCGGNSDYDWSMTIIVSTQILTVIVGSSVCICRGVTFFTMLAHLSTRTMIGQVEPYKSNPIWKNKLSRKDLCDLLLLIIISPIYIITLPVACLAVWLGGVIRDSEFVSNAVAEVTEEFEYLSEKKIGIDAWTLGKGLTEMKKAIRIYKGEPSELIKLLSKITPSQQSQVKHILDQVGSDGESIPVSILSVVLLIRITQVSLPKHLNSSLVKTFRQVYEFLCFIEKNLFLRSLEFTKKLEVAKEVWLVKDFSHLVDETFDECATGESQFDTNCALAIIAEVKSEMPEDVIYSELCIIENYINRRQYSSVKELYDYIEQFFVDMLHVILAQFPIAMFISLTESPGDDYNERVRLALKFVCEIEPLEAQIQWKFPEGSNLLGLITAPVLATEEEEDTGIEVETEDTATIAIHDENDVIIEVEDSNIRTVC